jgi:MscS family membrane protein
MKHNLETAAKLLLFLFLGVIGWSLWAAAQGDTGLATIEFARPAFTVSQGASQATLQLRRTGSTNAAVTVEFATEDDTAEAGLDYVAKAGPVTLAAGEMRAQVEVPLLGNPEATGRRAVRLVLRNPTGAQLGPQRTARLEIVPTLDARTALLTFGLNHVPFLRHPLFDVPLWQYLASLIYVFLAFYVSRFLDYFIRGRLKVWAARTRSQLDDLMLELLRGPIKVVAFVILLHIGLKIFLWPDWFADLLSNGLKVIVAISLAYMVLKLIDLLTGYWRQRAAAVEEDKAFAEQLLPIVRNSLKVFAIIVAVLLTLQNLGLNITSLITSLGIGGLALALAAQDTLANFFGAVVILLDKPFRIGDRIQLDSVDGTVEAIGFRSTKVRNLDGHLVAIPNKTVGNATVTNISRRPNIRSLINISLTYDTPAEKVQRAVALLEEIYRAHPMTGDVWISFNKFADSSLNLLVVHWWKGTVFKDYLKGMEELNLAIKKRFDQEALNFAFPTQTVHLKQQDGPWRLAGPDAGLLEKQQVAAH